MKKYFIMLLTMFLLSTMIPYHVMAEINSTSPSLFSLKFGKSQVFDCQRNPAYPIAGQSFHVSYLIEPYVSVEGEYNHVDWGINEDRYIKFSKADSATDNDARLKLILYESNGAVVETISEWGYAYGLFEEGLFYEGIGHYGYIFSTSTQFSYGDSHTFMATIGKVNDWDALYEYKNIPTVPSVLIEPSGTEIPITTQFLTITFSQPMDIAIPGTVKMSPDAIEGMPDYTDASMWDEDKKILTIPINNLDYKIQYTVEVSDFKDIAGNMSNFIQIFSTEQEEIIPKSEDETVIPPRQEDIIPEIKDPIPKGESINPDTQDVTPDTEDILTDMEKESHLLPQQENIPLSEEEESNLSVRQNGIFPRTGDETKFIIFLILLILSIISIIVLYIIKRIKHSKKDIK